jgi:hypothetical protein
MKTLVVVAMASMALLSAPAAEFFSLNGGGFYKITVPLGYKIIANQLIQPTNRVEDVFQGVPSGTIILKWDRTGFLWNQFDGEFNEWLDPNQTLVPGEGAFIFNPAPTNLTLYMNGELLQGTLSNNVPTGYSLLSSKIPQRGTLQTVLGFPPRDADQILKWVNPGGPASSGYQQYAYDLSFGGWDTEPLIEVGEGFFVLRSGAPLGWVRTFTIN